jgi:hypothetical protein
MTERGIRPTFLVIGAAKAGTTSLWRLLRQHPQIFMTARKEPHFFSFDNNYARGPAWYESHFEDGAGFPQRGEATTSYSIRALFPDTAQRVAAYDPSLKLIYIVREPLARIESTWQQLRRFGPAPTVRVSGLGSVPDSIWVDCSFNRAVRLQSDALVESTNYRKELAAYQKHFADEQILVLLCEDLLRDPGAVLRRCFEFLEVDPDIELSDDVPVENTYGSYPVLRPVLRRFWSTERRREASARVVDLLPAGLCERFSRWFLRVKLKQRPSWEPETRDWVLDILRDDLQQFLDEHGYPRDVWSLDQFGRAPNPSN